MERAKRLELLRSLLQASLSDETYKSLMQVGVQGDAHAKKLPEPDLKLQAWVAEMEQVIEAWPKIDPSVRTGLMAIVRSHSGVRPSR
jgi:hypothetical protein